MTPAVRAFVGLLLDVIRGQQLTIETQQRTIETQQRRIVELEAEVAELKQRLAKVEKFQHPESPAVIAPPEPPASVTPPETAVETPPKVTRKRGGQPGHRKHSRALIPVEECAAVVPVVPETCRGCGETLSGVDADPLRHQVWDIPEIKPLVTEYQRHRLTCSCCGTTTCGELPVGVPIGQTGPGLAALVTLLMVCFRLSKRRVSLFCKLLLNAPICPATVVKLQNIATAATRPAYKTLVKRLPREPSVNADETPTKQANRNAWIWVVVAASYTVFAVRLTKAAEVIKELLTVNYAGIVTSDRAKMYLWCQRLQWCWAHLKRDFEKIAQRPGPAGKYGQQLVDLTNEMFHHWHRVRDGTVTWRTFRGHYRRIQGEVYVALDEACCCADSATVATCEQLLDRFDNLWHFAETGVIEPTNNAAERALRHPVIWKQLSFGTQSASGSRFVETLLTVLETCRQRRKNAYAYLTEAIKAHFAGKKPPSLLARV